MSNDRDDAQGRAETPVPDGSPEPTGSSSWGRAPAYGPPPSGPDQHQYSPYGTPAGHDQSAYGQPQHTQPYGPPVYNQPAPGQYGQPSFGQPSFGQPSYGQAPPGQAPYGQAPHGQVPYGQPPFGQAPPARPGSVITAAVLGLVHGALGLLVTVGLLAGGALIDDFVDVIAQSDPTIDTGQVDSSVDDVRAALVGVAVVALAWTVVMVWGSVLALRGRSRVLLIVGSSIAVAVTGLVLLGGIAGLAGDPGADGQVGGVLFLLVFFLAALAMLVLLCLRSAARFFAAHRQRRAFATR
jgi:hypothetical protein